MENLKVKTENEELADNEEFRDIEGYEGLYQVSNEGRVYSVKRGKFLKPYSDKNGYLRVWLCKNGKGKNYLVHRIVASAFLENPSNLQDVNHRDENPSNNKLENLEWMSHKENINYGTRTEKCSKQVLQMTKNGEFVNEYPSTMEAFRQTRIVQQSISKCCRGKLHSAGGFVWKFKEEVA